MSKNKINISKNVMEQIHEENIKMRPRFYFVLGSIFMFVGLVLSFVASVFLFSLSRFVLRSHGPMGEYRLQLLLESFPWWAPILAVAGIVFGIWFLRKYDFSYKKNFKLIIIGLIFAVLSAVIMIEYFKLDEIWFKQGPMRGIMRQYLQDSNQLPRGNNRGNGSVKGFRSR